MISSLFSLGEARFRADSRCGPEFFETRIRPIFAAQCACLSCGKSTCGTGSSSPPPFCARRQRLYPPAREQAAAAIGYQAMSKCLHRAVEGAEIADITEWVKAGRADVGGQDGSSSGGRQEEEWTKAQKEFWSFKPIKEYLCFGEERVVGVRPPSTTSFWPSWKRSRWARAPASNWHCFA